MTKKGIYVPRVSAPVLSGMVCLAFLAFYNFSFWTQLSARAGLPFMFSVGILFTCIIFAVLTICQSRFLYKPILILGFFIAALSAYAMDKLGFIVATDTFQNLVETDAREIYDLLHWLLLRDLAVFFVLPSLFILFIRVEYSSLKVRILHLALCGVLFMGNLALFGKYYAALFRNHKVVKYYMNPIHPVYSLVKYTAQNLRSGVEKQFIELDPNPSRPTSHDKPKLIVLVVGESDRAINHQLNGYARATNPILSNRSDIYSFGNFYSCGTETTVSVPCMFSAFTRDNFTREKGLYTENVLDLLQKSRVKVLWRDNDAGCKNVCDRVEIHDFNEATIAPYCNAFECHDEVLLHNLQDYISKDVTDKFIVLHKKGNHGPAYYRRYPQKFAQFAPTCDTNELHNCSKEQIINTYDNIILYTDYFLDQVIHHLEQNNDKYQAAMIYVSDHGESLGERGIYLHAMPYWIAPKEQIHVPFIFWATKDFTIDRNHLRAVQKQNLSHDHLFHSLLGLFNVQTVAYDQQLDIFAKKP